MKALNRRFSLTIVVLITLLVIAGCQPGSKGQVPTTTQPTVTSTPTSTFTGSVIFDYEIDNLKTYHMWVEEGVHFRNVAAYWIGDFGDDRLDGRQLSVSKFDGDKRSTEKNWTSGNIEGTILVLDGSEEEPVRWDGAFTVVIEKNGNAHADYTLHGVGPYKGLTAKYTCEYQYLGELHYINKLKCQGAMYEDE